MRIFCLVFAMIAVINFRATPASAYFATLDTGDLVKPQKYRLSLSPQIIFNKYDGANITSRFDTGINEDSSVRAILGVGKVDFQIGGFYKYVPYPDTAQQPAIGGMAGLIIARVNGGSEVSLRFHPLISKRLNTKIGDVVPYGTIPLGITTRSEETFVPVQLAGGAEWKPENLLNFSFQAEIGLNISRSFSYIAAAAVFDFDEDTLKRRK